jgi:hypothetical protein
MYPALREVVRRLQLLRILLKKNLVRHRVDSHRLAVGITKG